MDPFSPGVVAKYHRIMARARYFFVDRCLNRMTGGR
jgi:hypothetical protein